MDPPSCPDPHDVNGIYRSSGGSAGTPDGPVFTVFLPRLSAGFGGNLGIVRATDAQATGDPAADPTLCLAHHCDWRLPGIGELRTILIGPDAAPGQATTCSVTPCIDSDFAAVGGSTASSLYWSTSIWSDDKTFRWLADFGTGFVATSEGQLDTNVRAVRAGSCN